MGLAMLGILIAAGCQTKVETFSSYMSDMENDVNKIVKDSARADRVVAELIELEQFFTGSNPIIS